MRVKKSPWIIVLVVMHVSLDQRKVITTVTQCSYYVVTDSTSADGVLGSLPASFPSVTALLKASSKGFLKSLNRPISSQFFRNFVGVGV